MKKSDFGQATKHLKDIVDGKIQTIFRKGANKNRKLSLKGIKTKKGFDRDEVPMAMFKEGGSGASVRYINPGDNRGAGASIGKTLSAFDDEIRVLFKII